MGSAKHSFWCMVLPPTILSIFTIIFYYSSLAYIFIFDDLPTITENIHIVKGCNNFWGELYASNRWFSKFLSKFCYKYWQANPVPFRIINLAIHILIGILIFFLVFKVLSELKESNFLHENAYLISILSSGLFLFHPFQTQTATYICQMQLEGGMTLLIFLVLTSFVYAAKTTNFYLKFFLYLLSAVFASIAAGTKEAVVVMPILLLVVDWFFVAQADWHRLMKRFFIHAMLFIVLLGTLQKLKWNPFLSLPTTVTHAVTATVGNNRGNILTATPEEKITTKPFFFSQFKVILQYLRMYFWPVGICFDYEMRLSYNLFDFDVIFPFLVLLLIFLIALLFFIKNRASIITFCVLWFFITILPRASIFISTELVNDYKCYLSSFGVFLFIAIFVTSLINVASKNLENFIRKDYKVSCKLIFAFLLMVGCGVSTKIRNNIWSNELLFWEDVVKKTPTKARNFNNYAVALSDAGRVSEALETYKKACELDPTYAEPVINLAFNYQMQGRTDLALEYYQKALTMREVHPEMYLNLGILHLHKKSYEKAEMYLKTAIKYRGYYSKAYFALAVVYQIQNRIQEAFECYSRGLAGDYQTIEHYYQHGVLGEKLSKFTEAIVSLEKVKELNSNFKEAAFILGSCYYNIRNYQKANENFELAYKKDPKNNIVAYNLAQSFLNLRKFDRALPLFKQCKDAQDKLPFIPLHVAKCLVELGQKNKAKIGLQSLIKNSKFEFVKNDARDLLKSIK